MARADVTIHSSVTTIYQAAGHAMNPVVTSGGNRYAFFITGVDATLWYAKSTDGGLTWLDAVQIRTGSVSQLAVWYDGWTPGDSGTKIHLAYADITPDDVFYRSLDTSSDTLGTETTIFAGASGLNQNAGINIALTKARGGNLLCLFDIDAGTETGFYRSIDAGANWTSRSNTAEGADYFLLAPGFAADNQDILCIFWDRSASEISRKIYDDSADSWAETSIAGSMTPISSTTCVPQMAISVDATNSKVILIAWTNRDTLNADLKCWTVDESTITAKTDVVTDSTDDQQMCAIGRDTVSGNWYAFYGGKSDGSETAGTSINIYYKSSSNTGTSWGSETLITLTARNMTTLFCPLTFPSSDFWVTFRALNGTQAGMSLLLGSMLIPSTVATNVFSGSVIQ